MIIMLLIGFALIVSIIGLPIILIRKNLIHGKNKVRVMVIGILQGIHMALYFSNLLAIITETNVYIGFAVCVVLSLTCLLLSLWLMLPVAKFNNAIKYLFLLFAVIQILTTIIIFLLPDMGGFDPLIQL
jgi:hypothetical protein